MKNYEKEAFLGIIPRQWFYSPKGVNLQYWKSLIYYGCIYHIDQTWEDPEKVESVVAPA